MLGCGVGKGMEDFTERRRRLPADTNRMLKKSFHGLFAHHIPVARPYGAKAPFRFRRNGQLAKRKVRFTLCYIFQTLVCLKMCNTSKYRHNEQSIVLLLQSGDALSKKKSGIPGIVGRFLCLAGFHDFRVINVNFSFGAGDKVEKVECRRCGVKVTRRG